MTDYKYLQTRREGPVVIATMVNPPKNFLNAPMVEELLALADTLAGDTETRVLVLTGGADGIFITHYDVGELTVLSDAVRTRAATRPRDDAPADRPRRELHALNRLSLKLAALPQPVIAAINGTAMAAAASWRWRATSASSRAAASSGCRRYGSASCRARAARSAWRGCSARRRRWS